MSDFVLVDTDVLIDVGRGRDEAITCLELIEQRSSLAISVVTQMELMIGCRDKKEMRALDQFLKRFSVARLSDHISDVAVGLLCRYRLSHGLLIADALIAATALSLDLPFVTKNRRDYTFIAELNLLGYPRPFTS